MFAEAFYSGLVLLPLMVSADDSARIIRDQLEDAGNNLTRLKTELAPPWVSGQQYRSTASILQTCIATLTACIYTALHLNISGKQGWKARLLEKLKWVAIGLFAPEVAIYLAVVQYLEARWVAAELTKLQSSDSASDKKFKFDLQYGFFVVMGGLQVPLHHLSENTPRDDRVFGDITANDCYETLSSVGVVALAQAGKFIYISPESVSDRSKANLIHKVLVFGQIIWMAMQCIVRFHYGLPLTLLELHTLIHVICANIMYALWFKKPLDITGAEVINLDGLQDTLHLLIFEHRAWNLIDSKRVFLAPFEAANETPMEANGSQEGNSRHTSDFKQPDPVATKIASNNRVANTIPAHLASAYKKRNR
ncbi:uncharacterized protein PG998_011949 [Apiospora kogelbergensis]|uniref:uncharacterized protein n=1 Tax=Apiospora kogelbergensis TaxID=1337665 RepID=UPI00312EC465